MKPPPGYTHVTTSNSTDGVMLVCDECGAAVGNVVAHDQWHDRQESRTS